MRMASFIAKGAVLTAFVLLVSPALPVQAEGNPSTELASLVTRGEDLMQSAFVIVRSCPESEFQAKALFGTVGRDWGTAEHAFQLDMLAFLRRSSTLAPDIREGALRLAQFDNFVFDGVADAYSCQPERAYQKLKIAAQILRHARMAVEGSPDPDWESDLEPLNVGEGGCR